MVSKHLILKDPAVVQEQQEHALLAVVHAHQQLELANVVNLKIINLTNK
jgi:hypothetical protein